MNIGRAYWEGRGFSNPIYTIAKKMERIQYKLHYNKDDTGEEFNLVGEHPGCQYGSNPYPDFQVPFHSDICLIGRHLLRVKRKGRMLWDSIFIALTFHPLRFS